MTGLLELLTQEGFNVQLKHIEQEDESTRDRVWLKNDAGEELASHADMQHNRNYSNMQANAQALFDEAKTKIAAAAATGTTAEAEATEEKTIFTDTKAATTETAAGAVVSSNA